APQPPLFLVPDLLGRLAAGDGIAHTLDLGAADAIGPQLAEQWPEMVLDASSIRPERRGLLVSKKAPVRTVERFLSEAEIARLAAALDGEAQSSDNPRRPRSSSCF